MVYRNYLETIPNQQWYWSEKYHWELTTILQLNNGISVHHVRSIFQWGNKLMFVFVVFFKGLSKMLMKISMVWGLLWKFFFNSLFNYRYDQKLLKISYTKRKVWKRYFVCMQICTLENVIVVIMNQKSSVNHFSVTLFSAWCNVPY